MAQEAIPLSRTGIGYPGAPAGKRIGQDADRGAVFSRVRPGYRSAIVDAYLRALSAGLRGVALPYGYTLAIWAGGQALIDLHGRPDLRYALLFVAGGAAPYGSLRWVAGNRESAISPQLDSPHLLRAGAVQLAAIGSAIGAAALLARLSGGVAWPLSGFAATSLYISVSTLELGLLESRRAREHRPGTHA